jgi:hypothetical protein
MPEPVEIVKDAFGEVVPAPEGAPEGDDNKDDGDKADEGKDDKKTDPVATIAELSKKIGELEALHGTKDTNIEAMRKKIQSLEKNGVKSEKGDEGDKAETMFPQVVFSKDLPKDQLEEMTDTEIKLFDETATLKQGMNKMFEAIKSGKDTTQVDMNTTARAEALRLASNDIKVANQIIEQFNEFNNTGLGEEQIIERVAKASKLIPDYKPPKEQERKDGGAVKKNKGSDPYGVDAIITESRKGANGKYSL